ncbi:MAG: hypothetical protein QNJ01_01840 [Desulfobacterales bacterium]|nr:hypothetical protein [Desulfobacterales bacterium]
MQTRYLIIAALITIVGLTWAGTAAAGPIQNRIKNQHCRINDGIASGALTYREARHLRRHQRKIRKMRHHFLADGRLSHRERRILNQRLNRNSDRIYVLKHNRRYYW